MSGLSYAINQEGKLVHIDSVPNGISCGCHCPNCGEILIAKNNGETMQSHFAHYYGTECAGGHETELHLLAKSIIEEECSVMLPSYGTIYAGGLQNFDRVEVERSDKELRLTPDICGIVSRKNGSESKLWIEIKVNHAIGFEKRRIITENNIACIEIDLSCFINTTITKEELKYFLIDTAERREWTNNPVLETKQRNEAQRKREYASKQNSYYVSNRNDDNESDRINDIRNNYLEVHQDQCLVPASMCFTCMHHTVRQVIRDEISRRHLPSWLKDALSCNLLWLTKDKISEIVQFDGCYCIRYQDYSRFLPTSETERSGRYANEKEIRQNKLIIPFLLNTVPDIIAAETLRCKYNMGTLPSQKSKYDVACGLANVVNKYRKNKRRGKTKQKNV